MTQQQQQVQEQQSMFAAKNACRNPR